MDGKANQLFERGILTDALRWSRARIGTGNRVETLKGINLSPRTSPGPTGARVRAIWSGTASGG